jgi:hypothetical protein
MQKRLPRNLPPLVDAQELPQDATACRLRDVTGWWLEIRCGCGATTAYPLRLMAGEQPRNPTLSEVLPRLRCKRCGERPTAARLIDNPGHHWGGSPQVRPLPLPWQA